jgi:probable selenium-dependent hydroxylase accessory protein YqeC
LRRDAPLGPPQRTTSLARALGVRRAGVHAFAGAGGKTSAIRRLLHERPDALATTTTHLALSGFGVGLLAAAPGAAALEMQLPLLRRARPLTLALYVGGPRLQAPPLEWLHRFLAAEARSLVLVEADGAAQHLVKLPAAHEPAWPPVAMQSAVVVVGLEALGAPARDVLHRHAAFARVGLRSPRVGLEHLARMLAEYARACPPRAPLAVLFSGAHPDRMAQVAELALHLRRVVQERDPRLQDPDAPLRVIATPDVSTGPYWFWNLRPARGARPAGGGGVALPGVCGVLLAAGSGRRFRRSTRGRVPVRGAAGEAGDSKLLTRWRGRTLVEHAVSAWCRAGFAEVVVVLGHDADRIEPLVRRAARGASLPVCVVRNRHHARGLGTSVRAAVRAASPDLSLLFGHADMPAVRPDTLRRIAALGSTLRRCIIVPERHGAPTNPVYFPPDLRAELARVQDAGGGKRVYAAHAERVFRLDLGDAPDLVDVDRAGDLLGLP